MLSPFPKSTVISPGIPRKACITRRWTFSVTGELLEQLAVRLRSVSCFRFQELGEAPDEIRGQIIQRLQQGLKELVCAWPMHRFVLARIKGEMPLKRTKNPRIASTAT